MSDRPPVDFQSDVSSARRAVFDAYLDRRVDLIPFGDHSIDCTHHLGTRRLWDGSLPTLPGRPTWTRTVSGAGNLGPSRIVPAIPSPDGSWLAQIEQHDILLVSAQDGMTRRLTHDGRVDIFWDIDGLAIGGIPTDHRLIASRVIGPWSPDGATLLAYRRYVADIFRVPMVDWIAAEPTVTYAANERAGGTLHRCEPVFIDVASAAQFAVPIDTTDHYVQLLGWHGADEALLILYSRALTAVQIVAVHRRTGNVRRLLDEAAATPLRIQLTEIFASAHGFHPLPNGSGFLWLSSRTGWPHLYRYNWSGQLIGALTEGEWPVHAVEHIDQAGAIYITASIDTERPYDVHVCRVDVGGSVKRLTETPGFHIPSFYGDLDGFIDEHSACDRLPVRERIAADSVQTLIARAATPHWQALGYQPPEEFVEKAADGKTDLWGVLYKPFDFSPERRYPVIEYIYAGPQSTAAPRRFSVHAGRYDNFAWALAQLGYIVFTVDARGTPGRSKAFQDHIQRQWEAPIADHAAVMAGLCRRHPWMDESRVGIYGHSWGGYYALRALLDAPDVYHAGAAYEPGFDPAHIILSEPYLGTPEEEPDAYAKADLFARAKNLSRPLLIASGTSYSRTVPSALRMVQTLTRAGIVHEFLLAPGAGHSFTGADEDYLIARHVEWFDRHVRKRFAASS